MISAKKDYQNIRSDREIATHLNFLELLLSQSNSDLQTDAKVRLNLSKKEFMKWSREIGTIRISLLNNPVSTKVVINKIIEVTIKNF